MGGEDLIGDGKDDQSFMDIDDDEEYQLPGFRFHPTDEELVSFYLRRKLDKKPIKIELIKQIDIYKYDPWDLPKGGSSRGGEKEWYFFCKRGRKYRNSIRPNRVTGSGFWKATGIDKPVYASHSDHNNQLKEYCSSSSSNNVNIIGLKKTLVYYRGSAGKGTKTDWMMHEFRLPSNSNSNSNRHIATSTSIAQEAEIWTLCRIFKRNVSKRKHIIPDWRSPVGGYKHKQRHSSVDKSTRMNINASTVGVDCDTNNDKEAYINFGGSSNNNEHEHEHYYYYQKTHEQKPTPSINNYNYSSHNIDERNHHHHHHQMDHHFTMGSQVLQHPQLITPPASAANDFFTFDNWDELGSVVKFAFDSSIM